MHKAITGVAGLLLLVPSLLLASPTAVVHQDVPNCDPLIVPEDVEELGTVGVFPLDEIINSVATTTDQAACPSDSPDTPNALVEITNLTNTAFSDVWYVADPFDVSSGVGTSISNFDGFLDQVAPQFFPGEAFKIDRLGINQPLISESIANDGIFQPNEMWVFIIDDYANSGGLAASQFGSIGVGSASVGGPPSSGSIIALPVPEPATFLMLLVGGAALAMGRWRRRAR